MRVPITDRRIMGYIRCYRLVLCILNVPITAKNYNLLDTVVDITIFIKNKTIYMNICYYENNINENDINICYYENKTILI